MTNYINQILNYLKSQSINAYLINDHQINTSHIQIESSQIISLLTGEILLEIPQNETIMDYIEYIPAIHSAIKKESDGWNPPPVSHSDSSDYEYNENEITSCGGFLCGKGITTNNKDGIKIHKCISKKDQYGWFKKTAEIVDAITGKVTDEFYGYFNDFNLTLLLKASKGLKFFLYVFDGSEKIKIQDFNAYIDNGKTSIKNGELIKECAKVNLRSNRLGEWKLLSWHDM